MNQPELHSVVVLQRPGRRDMTAYKRLTGGWRGVGEWMEGDVTWDHVRGQGNVVAIFPGRVGETLD